MFIYLFMAVLGLRFCARAFSSCGKRGPLFIAVRGPLTIAASLVAEHRLQTRRLSNCGSQAQLLCWIFPDQGSNLCPLHWQADSQPLCHQGSPVVSILYVVFTYIFYLSCLDFIVFLNMLFDIFPQFWQAVSHCLLQILLLSHFFSDKLHIF